MTEQYFNNPLHGLKLEALVTELVDFYGFEILAAALNFNCFKLNPSIKGSVKFLKKTEWARQKLEIFYLYKYKNLPRPDAKQYELPPRDRIIPAHQKPRDPIIFDLDELLAEQALKAQQAKDRARHPRQDARAERSSDTRPASARKPNKEKYGARAEDKPRRHVNSRTEKPRAPRSSDVPLNDDNPWASAKKVFDEKQKKD
ncbi:VF530 family DNA-binding protein [Reinekea sp. G2M2-21]|uniref:VF530 family protein n=1 Tax=Reinekea sp. G2M2-21 TaxID=2788942 RepID=UPI0018A9FA89|nr:VF530 family DNA-binding protein [Reinekea sp. G2M2-21]